MNYLRLIGPVRRSLLRNKARASLMMLSVTVGIASLMILSSIGDSTRDETMRRFKNMLGTFDTAIIRPGGAKSRGMVSLANIDPTLTFADAEAIGESPSVRQVAQVQNALDIDIKYRDRADTAGVFGVTANWPSLRGDMVSEGEFLDQVDVNSLSRVAIIGADVQAKLFGDSDAIGKTIRIGAVPFLVKGVLVARGAGPTGASLDNLVLIPVTTASKRLFNRDFLTMAIAQLKDPASSDQAIAEISRLLRRRHHLATGVLDDFTVTSPRAVMAQITALGSTFETLLSIVAVLATAIGGAVIMIVTLIGVSSRRVEIGLKRAIGAPRAAILVQFLAEAVLLSLGGGIVGVVLGIGGTQIVSAIERLPFVVDITAILSALAVSMAVGLVFGVYPALRAARTDPIEALRA
jgi:putative ABC transport system permease protein